MFMLSLLATLAHSVPALRPAERAAIFRAAGAEYYPKEGWALCYLIPDGGFHRARIVEHDDINGDGRPDAIVSQDSGACYGNTGPAFILVSKQANGRWKRIRIAEDAIGDAGQSINGFLKTRGVAGWPDVNTRWGAQCNVIFRFNGKAYVFNRMKFTHVDGSVEILDPRKYDIGCNLRTHKPG